MSAPAARLPLSDAERQMLERLAHAQSAPHRQVVQARVLLLAGDGVANAVIAEEVGVTALTVRAWRRRFREDGLAGLEKIRAGRGRKPSISEEIIAAIVRLTTTTTPAGATHWSCRTMAKQVGVSSATVQRIWSDLGLKPHLVESFKVSNDPQFEAKLIDVVGLYLNPPEKAIVLCMDEKSQIQALDRTQASLPMTPGRAGTMTHDYKRNGTTTLFAALDVLTGTVIGQCLPRHRHTEFLKFLNTIDREVPKGLQVHLILDNYSTHKHAEVGRWLNRHKRFHLHFTPTSSSWLNQVERWFRDLTDKNLRRGIFASVPDLIASIEEYLNAHNADPKPYMWTATAGSILAKVQHARTKLEQVINQN
jgi:transposase